MFSIRLQTHLEPPGHLLQVHLQTLVSDLSVLSDAKKSKTAPLMTSLNPKFGIRQRKRFYFLPFNILHFVTCWSMNLFFL